MKYIWLSYPLGITDPRPPAIPAPELSDFMTIEKDGASVQIIKAANHTGSHLDTAGHVIKDGISITAFSPPDLIFKNISVVEMKLEDKTVVGPEHLTTHTKALKNADMAIFKFGYGRVRAQEHKRYSECCPGFGVESAKWLRENCPNLRCVGIDVPSIATIAELDYTMAVHNVLLEGNERKFIIIEEMNLEYDLQDLESLIEIRVNPWLVSGMNSGPCSVIGVMDHCSAI